MSARDLETGSILGTLRPSLGRNGTHRDQITHLCSLNRANSRPSEEAAEAASKPVLSHKESIRGSI